MEKSIIEYSEIGRKWLVFKMPGKEIKKGTSLLVRPGQLALVYSNGELLREYLPGKYSLDEIAVSKKAYLESKLGNSDNVIATDIYYINTSLFMNNGWGTKDPVIKRDNELGIIRVTAFGNYSFKITDAKTFVNEVFGTRLIGTETGETVNYISNYISGLVAMELGAVQTSYFDMTSQYTSVGNMMLSKINQKMQSIGVCVTEINVEHIGTVGSVDKALDEFTQMNVANLNFELFEKYQKIKAVREAVSTPGNAIAMEVGTVMGKQIAKIVDIE